MEQVGTEQDDRDPETRRDDVVDSSPRLDRERSRREVAHERPEKKGQEAVDLDGIDQSKESAAGIAVFKSVAKRPVELRDGDEQAERAQGECAPVAAAAED